jgi:hypothetical protein
MFLLLTTIHSLWLYIGIFPTLTRTWLLQIFVFVQDFKERSVPDLHTHLLNMNTVGLARTIYIYIYMCVYICGVYTVLLAVKYPNVRSCTVHIHVWCWPTLDCCRHADTHTHTNTHTHTHTLTHTHTHTYTHKHTHTQMHIKKLSMRTYSH